MGIGPCRRLGVAGRYTNLGDVLGESGQELTLESSFQPPRWPSATPHALHDVIDGSGWSFIPVEVTVDLDALNPDVLQLVE